MLSGMLLGHLLRKKNLKGIHKMITLFIWILLFLLGTEVGGNKSLMKALPTLGVEAVLIAFSALLGSVLAAWALWSWLCKRKEVEKG